MSITGLDIPKHGEPAYPAEAYGHGWGEKGDSLAGLVKQAVKSTNVFTNRGLYNATCFTCTFSFDKFMAFLSLPCIDNFFQLYTNMFKSSVDAAVFKVRSCNFQHKKAWVF